MDVDLVILGIWAVLPLMMYGSVRVVIPWRERRARVDPPFDPALRLQQLRRQRELGHRATRGRMAEALRLAENSAPTSALQLHHH